MTTPRRWRRFFQREESDSARHAASRQTSAFQAATVIVRCCYGAILFLAVSTLPDWAELLQRTDILPLWPVEWLRFVELRTGILAILLLFLAGALLGATRPERRWARSIAFIGLFEFVAFQNSFGKINHSLHLWVLTSFGLIFLPSLDLPSRVVRQRFLLIFWVCQATVLLTYSMSGLGKLAGGLYQLCVGQNHIFLPEGLAATVADRLLQTNSRSLLGPWLIAHPLFGIPLTLGTVYLQFFSFWIAFRPAAQRPWAVALILFHIGSFLLLSIQFFPSVLLLALLFLGVPGRPSLAALPLFGKLLEKMFSCFPRRTVSL